MATPAGRIEKEFLLKVMFEEKQPVTCILEGTKYTLTLERPAKEELVFRSGKSPGKLKVRSKLSLLFDYRGQTIDFNVEVLSQQGDLIFCKAPETLYKNPERGYSRVDVPPDFKISLTFKDNRNNTVFPKVVDISASGLLFACPLGSELLPALTVNTKLTVIIEAPNRTMKLAAAIVRHFKDRTTEYFGCRFENMAPEDMRFLYERLYEKLFDSPSHSEGAAVTM